MKNKIAIDVRMINASGIGVYIQNILPNIINSLDNYHFYLLGDLNTLLNYEWTQKSNVSIINLKSKIYSLSEQRYLLSKIPKDSVLFWSPHYIIPVFYKGKILVTVHDIFHLAKPEFVGGFHKKLYAKLMFKAVSKKADAIISVSDFTTKEFLKFVNRNQNNIYTIYNGVNNFWREFLDRDTDTDRNPYIVYVGNVKPHKNLISLVKAFEKIKNEIPHNLVIIGKKEGFITGDQEVIKYAERLGDRIKFTGFVDNETLKRYIANAHALVFPSLYEGFGLPPLEAMACGCPVIVSNVASLPEVCGDAALYIDPYSPEDIAEKIKLLLSDDKLRKELRRKGLERAKMFSWEKCAKETLEVIEEVLAK
ncbi:glycosyltransferase family 1 protein [Geobacillus stearothermophilus]|uniref:glycosyltransferase family 4 protein n=1 Tax=Geobacillus stearothermophilus TaxID=1422 RepID=UPI002E1B4976|nr:glycosyltransferase family 1 protein [Geobacillus stearothermophilus]